MHKWENDIGVLTQIVDAKLRLPHLPECRMKVSAPTPLTPARKADHPTNNRLAAQPQKKPELARSETLNQEVSPRQATSVHRARLEKASSAPQEGINARRRPDAWAQPPEALSSPGRAAPAAPPTLKQDRPANQISIAPADRRCKKRDPAALQECNSSFVKKQN
jgi:hypothetical protein